MMRIIVTFLFAFAIHTTSLAAEDFGACRGFFLEGTPPSHKTIAKGRALCFSEFAVMHSGETKTPIYVAERLNAASLRKAARQRTDRFFADARLPRAERAELDDYKGSGYDRGHMAPAADMSTAEGMAQSFSLANMVPQAPVNNRKVWSGIEKSVRKYVMRAKGDVFVITGVIYSGRAVKIGNGVRVPQYMYKLVHDKESGRTWAHFVPNTDDAIVDKPHSYADIVAMTGMLPMPTIQVVDN